MQVQTRTHSAFRNGSADIVRARRVGNSVSMTTATGRRSAGGKARRQGDEQRNHRHGNPQGSHRNGDPQGGHPHGDAQGGHRNGDPQGSGQHGDPQGARQGTCREEGLVGSGEGHHSVDPDDFRSQQGDGVGQDDVSRHAGDEHCHQGHDHRSEGADGGGQDDVGGEAGSAVSEDHGEADDRVEARPEAEGRGQDRAEAEDRSVTGAGPVLIAKRSPARAIGIISRARPGRGSFRAPA